MSTRRAKNLKNHAAIRRNARRIDRARTETAATVDDMQPRGVQIKNLIAEDNGGYGMVVDGAAVHGSNVRLARNGKGGLKARDADVRIDNLEIE